MRPMKAKSSSTRQLAPVAPEEKLPRLASCNEKGLIAQDIVGSTLVVPTHIHDEVNDTTASTTVLPSSQFQQCMISLVKFCW